MRQWFFARQGQTRGPFTHEQLRAHARSGELLPDDLVSYTGASSWVPARQVPNLFRAAAPPPPPPSSPLADALGPVLQPLLRLPKPILFGIFGGVGGLLGALLLGEVLWAFLRPASLRPLQPQVRLGVPAAANIYAGGKNRFVVKLARDGFKGSVRIEADSPPEGIRFAAADVPEDSEEAEVEVEAAAGLPPGTHTLTVWGRAPAGRDVQDGSGSLELTVEPLPAALRLSVPSEVPVFQGGKTLFRIRLARHNLAGPVKLHFHGLPEGITLPDKVVPADRSEAEFTVEASQTSKLGESSLTLIGTLEAEGARAVSRFDLRVRAQNIPQADIVFVLDLTGSMEFAIQGIKQGIQNFADELERSRVDARIALIGFRDIEGDRERPFVMTVGGEAFTRDYEAFKQEVGKLKAENHGNNDPPESCLQGLSLAAKQPFRPTASSVLLLITDAAPKIHRGENPSTVGQTIDELTRKTIRQLHLVVCKEDYRDVYAQFHKTFKGSFFDLNQSTSGDAFQKILPELSRKISSLTIASLPRTPGEVPALPPLPVEAQAPPAPAVETAVLKAVQSTQAYTHRDRYRLLLATAVWTMAVAGCISLLILVGQRYYACRRFAGPLEGSKSLGGGFLAGLVGGAAGQLLFQVTAGGTAWDVASRLLGWGLLGGLIGIGMSFFVPNLKWWRGLAGGLVGGLLGAGAFVLVSLVAGGLLGRWIGAGILGFCIGLMVALAELAFRRYWLEVAFSPREVRTVTLGVSPVSLGGDERRVAVAVPGSPPIALRYWIDGERVLCKDVIKERTAEVHPGDRKALGKVTVTLCSAAHSRKIGCSLELSSGASFHLVEGLPLTSEDLPGLQPQGSDDVVALVSSRPNDPATLLLRNRSKQAWVLRRPEGEEIIQPGRGLELMSGGSISFGQLHGTLRRNKD